MTKLTQTITLSILGIVFLTPLCTLVLGLEGISLSGVTSNARSVELSMASFLEQRFQTSFEKRFFKQTGLHGYLVKTDNQLNLLVFRQLSSNPKSNVILGKDKHLIERVYLKRNAQLGRANKKRLNRTIHRLAGLNQSLRERGVPLLLVISPHKAALHPEVIPPLYRLESRAPAFENLLLMTAALKQNDIPFIDGVSLLKERTKDLQQSIFAPSGTHWNQLGGCLVAAEIMKHANELSDKPFPTINCSIEGQRPKPAYPDTDLLQMANLWWPESLLEPAPLVRTEASFLDNSFRPQLLIIGSSFVWELLRQFEAAKATHRTDFLYYFKRKVLNSADTGRPIDREHFDFDAALTDKDLVLIEINQAALGKASFGFAKHYLEHSSPIASKGFSTGTKRLN